MPKYTTIKTTKGDLERMVAAIMTLSEYYEREKRLRLEWDDCDAPFCLDLPGCSCSPEQKVSSRKEREKENGN